MRTIPIPTAQAKGKDTGRHERAHGDLNLPPGKPVGGIAEFGSTLVVWVINPLRKDKRHGVVNPRGPMSDFWEKEIEKMFRKW